MSSSAPYVILHSVQLDEEKSKCAGLAQQMYVSSAQFAVAGKSLSSNSAQKKCNKYEMIAAQYF